jgi:TonB family protein
MTWTALVDLTLKSTLVLALAWLTAFALRRRSAAARHIVWTAASAALLALPLLALSLPSWNHPFANSILPADSGVTFRTAATSTDSAEAAVLRGQHPAAPSTPARPTAFDPRAAIVLLWAAGVALAFTQMLVAYAAVWRLRRGARPFPRDVAALEAEQPVSILETASGMPMTAGILRPAIFLPAESASWTTERIRIVLQHELAHILRGDAATQLLARAALCLYWFNPLAWMAWREFLKERERAADDLVLNGGALASEYASHLLEVARTMQSAPLAAGAGVAMARPSQLEGRLLAILDSRVKRTHPRRAALAVALLAAVIATAPLATVRAQSKAEQSLPPDLDATIRTANAQKNHELLEQAAVAYEKLRKFAEAQRLREAALVIRHDAGDRSVKYAEGLVKLGDLAVQRNAFAEATEFYTAAVAIGDMPETVPALITLGLDNVFRKHDPAAGRDFLQRARNASKSGNDMGRAMSWLAYLDQGDPANAGQVESLYRSAISMEDLDSPVQAMSTEMLARFLRTQGRVAEAESLSERAQTMRKSLAAALSTRREPGASIGIKGTEAAVPSAVKVGNGVSAPRLLLKMEPEYTEAGRAMKQQGTVLLQITVDVDGFAKDIKVIQGLGMGLDEKAVEAVTRWQFKPGESNGVPVPVLAQVEINFRLM